VQKLLELHVVEEARAERGLDLVGDHFEGGCLAGAVDAEQAEAVAPGNGEADVVDGADFGAGGLYRE